MGVVGFHYEVWQDCGVGVLQMFFQKIPQTRLFVVLFLLGFLELLQLSFKADIGAYFWPPTLTQFKRLMKSHVPRFNEIGNNQRRRLHYPSQYPRDTSSTMHQNTANFQPYF